MTLPTAGLLLVTLGLAAPPLAGAGMDSKTLWRFQWAADPRISPDGLRIVFVRISVNADEDAYRSRLWILDTDTGQSRMITHGERDESPRWSPDGEWIAFLRQAERNTRKTPGRKSKPPEKRAQVFVLPTDGGEALQLTDLREGVESIVWAPDSKRIVFTSRQPPPRNGVDLTGLLSDMRKARAVVVTRPVFRRDGEPGLIDPDKRSHLWSVTVDGASPEPLTRGPYDERDAVFSPDGATLFFASDRRDEPWFGPQQDADVFAIPSDGGEQRRVFDVNGPLDAPAISPDGKTIAALGYIEPSVTRSYNQTDLLVTRGGKVANVTKSFDWAMGHWIGGDAHPPVAGHTDRLRFLPDGRNVVALVSRRGRCGLVEIDIATHDVTDLVTGDREVIAWSMTPDGRRFALLIAGPTRTGEIYVYDHAGPLRQLTHIQEDALNDVSLTEPEEIWFDSFDGRRINGWILKPADFDPTRKYPMVLEIHGGPHIAYGYGFYQEFHLLAARGFVVLYINPRGSTTYGQDFGNIIQYAYPGDDFRDLMAGVDHVVATGYVDERRLGVAGGSGGGLLTNWAISHTDRFAAAVTQRCVSDWAGFYYTTDFTLYTPFWFRKAPFEDPAEYARRSPITYVDRINTPLMIIHSENDYRTPIAQGEAMFRALVALRKPVTMVRFPGSSHGLSRNGKPSLRIQRMDHIVNWFDLFLNGRMTDVYGARVRAAAERGRTAESTTSGR